MLLLKCAKTIFYTSIFYGCCVIALAFASNCMQGIGANSLLFYVIFFCGTCWYYNRYYPLEILPKNMIGRSHWCYQHRRLMSVLQMFFLVGFCVSIIWYGIIYRNFFRHISLATLALLILFPLLNSLYSGIDFCYTKQINLRSFGWFKPFVIGAVWAGYTTLYPTLFFQIENNKAVLFTQLGWWLFFNNFLFISILSIIFDFKDIVDDAANQLKTFAVTLGKLQTICKIVIPLSFLGVAAVVIADYLQGYALLQIALDAMPYCLVIVFSRSLRHHHNSLYYLAIVDGQMLVKAVCNLIVIWLQNKK